MVPLTTLEAFEDKKVVFTCSVCKQKVSFEISARELTNASDGPGLIKRAINHNNDHIIVVHVDLNCNVRRMYEYPCAIDTTSLKVSEGTENISVINISMEDVKKDPRGAILAILGGMEKASKVN
ncbi:MAG: hypothetical protein ACXAEU_03300 [Candidatus Hodarchaeales archaeon]|jgi:hypothetical protein